MLAVVGVDVVIAVVTSSAVLFLWSVPLLLLLLSS